MEIQLSIFKHFKYSKNQKKLQNGDNQFTKYQKEKITCQWIFYSSRDNNFAGKMSQTNYISGP